MGAARIGKIRMKSGGAEVRVLHTPEHDSCRAQMISDVRMIASAAPECDVIGYVIVAVYDDGGCSKAYDFRDNPRLTRPLTLAYLNELIRESVVDGEI